MSNYILIHSEDVCHWGIKGQKWGVRRWQNEDGSLTPAGREHYGLSKEAKKTADTDDKYMRRQAKKAQKNLDKYNKTGKEKYAERARKKMRNALYMEEYTGDKNYKKYVEVESKMWKNLENYGILGNALNKKYETILKEQDDTIERIFDKYDNMTVSELQSQFSRKFRKIGK